MKRYIRSSRKDDLLKAKAAWQMKYDARKQLYDDQESKYDAARWDWKDNVEDQIRSTFSAYLDKLPDFKIYVDSGWGGIEIRMSYEHLHNEAFSLNWDYKIQLKDNGDIVKESSSWSGLKAVTAEQIDDLMNSVNFLKALVDFDWAPLLKEAKNVEPKYKQYVGVRDPRYDDEYKDPGYDKMIREEEINEAIAAGKWIKHSKEYGENTWLFIVSQTPKFYNVFFIREDSIRYALRNPEAPGNAKTLDDIRNPQNRSKYYIQRFKKDSLHFASPVEAKSGEELIQSVQQQMLASE